MVMDDEEAQLSFLLSGTCGVVPSSYFKLQSYLNIHLSNLAEQLNLNLPKNLRNRNKKCPYCYSSWSSDTSSFKLLPSKKIKQSEKERKVNKSLIKEPRNTLVLKCKVCTNKSFFSLVKKKPAKELVKEEIVKSVKKKKKKKDKSCGLIVNLKTGINCVPEVSEKEKRLKKMKESKKANSAAEHFQNNQSKSLKNSPFPKDKSNSVSGRNKKLVFNPFALQSKAKFSKKGDKKLQSLKKVIEGEKNLNLAKKTLKDFLTLI